MEFSQSKFEAAPIVGILRGMPEKEVLTFASAFEQAGFHALEITLNTEGALGLISLLKEKSPGLTIGAGTVCSLEDLDAALAAGASFIVTPVLVEEVVQACVQKSIPVFPGAFTPSEIFRAQSLGATAVKVFPAVSLGPSYIKQLLAPLSDLKLLPTGGVSLNNMAAYVQAGAYGFGMGGNLMPEGWSGGEEELLIHMKEIRMLFQD